MFVFQSACQSPIAQSHIDANVPDKSSFNRLLERDLKTYFERTLKRGDPLRLEYQLLRDGPTQTGISYPKFYLWVKVYTGKETMAEGAIRVAAVERQRFDVTDFITKNNIVAEPAKVQLVFPAALNEKILRLAGIE